MTDEYFYYDNQKRTGLFAEIEWSDNNNDYLSEEDKITLSTKIKNSFSSFEDVICEETFAKGDISIKNNSITVVSNQSSQIKITVKDSFCDLLKFKKADGSSVQIVYKENGIFILRPVGSSSANVRTTYYFDDVGFGTNIDNAYRWKDKKLLHNTDYKELITPDANRTVSHKRWTTDNLLFPNRYELSNWGSMQIQGKAISIVNWVKAWEKDERNNTYSDSRDKNFQNKPNYYTNWHLQPFVQCLFDIPNADNWKRFTIAAQNNQLTLRNPEEESDSTTSTFNQDKDIVLLCYHGPGEWKCTYGFSPFDKTNTTIDSSHGIYMVDWKGIFIRLQLGRYGGFNLPLEVELDCSNMKWSFLPILPLTEFTSLLSTEFTNIIYNADDLDTRIIQGREYFENYINNLTSIIETTYTIKLPFKSQCYDYQEDVIFQPSTLKQCVLLGNGLLHNDPWDQLSHKTEPLNFNIKCKIIKEPVLQTNSITKEDFVPKLETPVSTKNGNGDSHCFAYLWSSNEGGPTSYFEFYSGIHPRKLGYFPQYCPLIKNERLTTDPKEGTYIKIWMDFFKDIQRSNFIWQNGQMVHVNQGEGEKYNAILYFNQNNPEPGSSGASTNYFYAALHNKEYFENQKYIKPVLCTNFREAWDIDIRTTTRIEEKEGDKPTWYIFKFNKPNNLEDSDLVVAEYSGINGEIRDLVKNDSSTETQWIFKYQSTKHVLDNLNMRLVIYRPKAKYELKS